MKWIKDEDFLRGDIPMTKFEVRTLTIAALELQEGDVLLDVGAGTGSVSIEAALQGASVVAIERENEGVCLIKENAMRFGAKVEVIEGEATEAIAAAGHFNKCFIGGSGGKLAEIVDMVDERLSSGDIIAANFVTLDNMHEFKTLLKGRQYKVEIQLVETAKVCSRTGILKANNPVFIIKGVKN